MEGGKQSRLLSRLLSKLRPDHQNNHLNKQQSNHQNKYLPLAVNYSLASTVMSEITERSFTTRSSPEDDSEPPETETADQEPISAPEEDIAANIDLRYGGQYFTPEQLPEFCDQLHHLVAVIRNIQSYSTITGEYPSELERRLEQEAAEVAALAAEARNARDVVTRTRAQRRAVRVQRRHLVTHLSSLRETEIRELEGSVRLSDRKLYKNWESLKDSTDAAAFEPLLDDIRAKQDALDCLVRLIDSRRAKLARGKPMAHPLPPPPSTPAPPLDQDEASGRLRSADAAAWRGRKRRRREARSVPLSGQPSVHRIDPTPMTGIECRSRYRVGSAGTVALPALELPSGPGVRDILFFTNS